MTFKVYIVADAENDIIEIYNYIATYDCIEHAEHVYENIKVQCMSLDTQPKRGHAPPELERIGIFEYREIHFKPYRIIYQVIKTAVYVQSVLDGRREIQELLEKRLLK